MKFSFAMKQNKNKDFILHILKIGCRDGVLMCRININIMVSVCISVWFVCILACYFRHIIFKQSTQFLRNIRATETKILQSLDYTTYVSNLLLSFFVQTRAIEFSTI